MKLNGVQIKNPTTFKSSRFKLSKAGRLASGLMMMDIIAKKWKFAFSYDVISGTDMKVILDILDSDAAFYDFEWVESNVIKTCKVYPGELKYDKFRTDGVYYYKNFSFDLIEQ